jgi:CBS domain-containing protein
MLCPVCRHDNFEGDDNCANCGADLWSSDTPEQALGYRGPLLGESLVDLGVTEPQMIEPGATIADAIGRMRETGSDCLLVVDGDRLVGIFTDRDAVLKVAGRPDGSRQIRELMTPDPMVLQVDDPIALAVHEMASGGFRHIPVMGDGRLPIGVVAARDVFRHVVARLEP